MTEVVLLSGFLNKEKMEKTKRQISSPNKVWGNGKNHDLVLVIDSEGGNVSPTLDFIDFLDEIKQKNGVGIISQVYNASSAAALIALSGDELWLDKDGSIDLHLASPQKMEASDLNLSSGQISSQILEQLRRYDQYLRKVLEECGLSQDPRLTGELYGSNWLRFNSERAVKHCLVNGLF